MVEKDISDGFQKMIDENKDKEMIDATKLTLSDWLNLLTPDNIEKFNFVHWSFPTEGMRNEYLGSIGKRTVVEVKNLMRNFLIPSCSLGLDEIALKILLHSAKYDKDRFNKLLQIEFYRRLLKAAITNEATVWEGNTWILDLLPGNPKEALEALEAYFLAHWQHLPDGRWDGLQDAKGLVRAKFIQTPTSELLRELSPYQLEHLIDSLYSNMGYKTTLTKKTHDGGIDILAVKDTAGDREKVLIQCKQKKKNVGVEIARELLGVVSDHKANKGVLVAPKGFTPAAKELQRSNPRLELLSNPELQILLNTHLGSDWPKLIDYLIANSLKKRKALPS